MNPIIYSSLHAARTKFLQSFLLKGHYASPVSEVDFSIGVKTDARNSHCITLCFLSDEGGGVHELTERLKGQLQANSGLIRNMFHIAINIQIEA